MKKVIPIRDFFFFYQLFAPAGTSDKYMYFFVSPFGPGITVFARFYKVFLHFGGPFVPPPMTPPAHIFFPCQGTWEKKYVNQCFPIKRFFSFITRSPPKVHEKSNSVKNESERFFFHKDFFFYQLPPEVRNGPKIKSLL